MSTLSSKKKEKEVKQILYFLYAILLKNTIKI